MKYIPKIGSAVGFVDSAGQFRHALVQKVFDADENTFPMVSLLYVDDGGDPDNLGYPELHVTSINHESNAGEAGQGFYWYFPTKDSQHD